MSSENLGFNWTFNFNPVPTLSRTRPNLYYIGSFPRLSCNVEMVSEYAKRKIARLRRRFLPPQSNRGSDERKTGSKGKGKDKAGVEEQGSGSRLNSELSSHINLGVEVPCANCRQITLSTLCDVTQNMRCCEGDALCPIGRYVWSAGSIQQPNYVNGEKMWPTPFAGVQVLSNPRHRSIDDERFAKRLFNHAMFLHVPNLAITLKDGPSSELGQLVLVDGSSRTTESRATTGALIVHELTSPRIAADVGIYAALF